MKYLIISAFIVGICLGWTINYYLNLNKMATSAEITELKNGQVTLHHEHEVILTKVLMNGDKLDKLLEIATNQYADIRR